jgi:hypothetical protein
VPQTDIPEDVRRLADARQAARDARDFDEADRLRAEIEAAGWKVIDQRTSYRLQAAGAPDLADGARTRYGRSERVPTRADEPATGLASVVLVATDRPDELERALAGLAGAVDDDVHRIVVANGPSPEQETLLARWEERWAAEAAAAADDARISASTEVVWMVERVGVAAALNAGIRRAAADVVVLLDTAAEALGDFVGPAVRALDDPSIAVAGPWGLASADLRRFEPVSAAEVGETDVAAIDLAAMAFRRGDYVARGPLDERFVEPVLLDAWWSLVLRDPDETQMTPRRAVLVDVPLVRRDADAIEGPLAPPDPRVVRRNRYRIIDTFGGRRDLAVARR